MMPDRRTKNAKAAKAATRSTPPKKAKTKAKKKPKRPPCTLAINDIIGARWQITERAGKGAFGDTFFARCVPTTNTSAPAPALPGLFAVKVEAYAHGKARSVLKLEAVVLRKLGDKANNPYVCNFVEFGKDDRHAVNYLVMTAQGQNLLRIRRQMPQGIFSLPTVLKFGIQALDAIRSMHDIGYVHRDIKPSNFVAAKQSNTAHHTATTATTTLSSSSSHTAASHIVMIDFGLARCYKSRKDGSILPERKDMTGFRGTPRYSSWFVHNHRDLGRRDDLWSLLYILVEFTTGTLPWGNYRDKDEIGAIKRKFLGHLLIQQCAFLEPFLNHIGRLKFADAPNYDLLTSILQRKLDELRVPMSVPFDWEDGTHDASLTGSKARVVEQGPEEPDECKSKSKSISKDKDKAEAEADEPDHHHHVGSWDDSEGIKEPVLEEIQSKEETMSSLDLGEEEGDVRLDEDADLLHDMASPSPSKKREPAEAPPAESSPHVPQEAQDKDKDKAAGWDSWDSTAAPPSLHGEPAPATPAMEPIQEDAPAPAEPASTPAPLLKTSPKKQSPISIPTSLVFDPLDDDEEEEEDHKEPPKTVVPMPHPASPSTTLPPPPSQRRRTASVAVPLVALFDENDDDDSDSASESDGSDAPRTKASPPPSTNKTPLPVSKPSPVSMAEPILSPSASSVSPHVRVRDMALDLGLDAALVAVPPGQRPVRSPSPQIVRQSSGGATRRALRRAEAEVERAKADAEAARRDAEVARRAEAEATRARAEMVEREAARARQAKVEAARAKAEAEEARRDADKARQDAQRAMHEAKLANERARAVQEAAALARRRAHSPSPPSQPHPRPPPSQPPSSLGSGRRRRLRVAPRKLRPASHEFVPAMTPQPPLPPGEERRPRRRRLSKSP